MFDQNQQEEKNFTMLCGMNPNDTFCVALYDPPTGIKVISRACDTNRMCNTEPVGSQFLLSALSYLKTRVEYLILCQSDAKTVRSVV